MTRQVGLVALLTLVGCAAHADEVDPKSLYELSVKVEKPELKVGETSQVQIAISPKTGAHVSDEAPLKITLHGKNVKLAKETLTYADSQAKKKDGEKYAAPRFSIPLTADAAGPGEVEGKLTFFICTDKVCSRQQQTVTLPLVVK